VDTICLPLATLAEAPMRRRLTGFTLTELLAVLGIMGVLAVLGAPSFTNLISSNRFQSSGRIQGNAASSFLITSTGTSAAQRCVTAATSGRSYVKSSAC
jgi:prepilin-type N-terminal cleavage/methylation domain-containing protein